MARLNKEAKTLLVSIHDAVKAGTPGYLFVDRDAVKVLISAKPPLALVNETLPDPEGKNRVAAVVSPEGIAEADKARAAGTRTRSPGTPVPGPAGEIEIESGIVVPETKRGRGAAENPWNATIDRLSVGQSFFIPVSDVVPEPWKKYSGLASSANKRYNKEGSTDPRRFIIRESEKNGQKGARLWRIENAKPGTSAADAQKQADAAQAPAGGGGFTAPQPTA